MHRWPLLLRAAPTALLLLAAVPSAAQPSESGSTPPTAAADEPIADQGAIDWTEWTPSASAGIGIFAQKSYSAAEGRYSTVWNASTNGPALLRDEFEKTLNGPYFPFGVELMGPSLRRLPGQPRFFLHGGYGWSREEKNLLARAFIADLFPDPSAVPESSIQMFGKPEDLILAGVGTSFQFELGEYPVFFRPSLNFFTQRVVLDVVVVQEEFANNTLRRNERTDQWFYYVGPQLELAAEVGRQGPIGFQIFGYTSIAFTISDRDMGIQGVGNTYDINGVPTPDDPDTFYFQYDNLRIAGGAGLRLVWYGAD